MPLFKDERALRDKSDSETGTGLLPISRLRLLLRYSSGLCSGILQFHHGAGPAMPLLSSHDAHANCPESARFSLRIPNQVLHEMDENIRVDGLFGDSKPKLSTVRDS
jgi:hypothetical protein